MGKCTKGPVYYWPEIYTRSFSNIFFAFITACKKPALKCNWFFYFAHQGDHFTFLTGLAHSRFKTWGKWIEASVSDVLLTCWANNFHHQQFYLALLVPTVKLTMHSISIRQEDDPCCSCALSAESLQRCAKKQTITFGKNICLFVKYNIHSLVDEHNASESTIWEGDNFLYYQILVCTFGFTATFSFTCPG